ncbi:MAG: hypothetical protein AAF663_07155 [Planctomycetota bacterium]
MIVFRPVSGGATCTGTVQSDGTYSIATGTRNALVPGDYLVSIRVVELLQSETKGAPPLGRPVTPAVYADPLTSGLSFNVRAGSNTYDLLLESSAGPAVLPRPGAVTDGQGAEEATSTADEDTRQALDLAIESQASTPREGDDSAGVDPETPDGVAAPNTDDAGVNE